jgi:hypothetical protein
MPESQQQHTPSVSEASGMLLLVTYRSSLPGNALLAPASAQRGAAGWAGAR